MFKGRLLYILLILGFGAFCFYLANFGFKEANAGSGAFLPEESQLDSLHFFEGNEDLEQGNKYILYLDSGKEIVLFDGMDGIHPGALEKIKKGDLVRCRYKAELFQKNMIFGPVELWVGTQEIISFKEGRDSARNFARNMLYLGIIVSGIGLYLLAAVIYVLVKRRESHPSRSVFRRVGLWLLGEHVKI